MTIGGFIGFAYLQVSLFVSPHYSLFAVFTRSVFITKLVIWWRTCLLSLHNSLPFITCHVQYHPYIVSLSFFILHRYHYFSRLITKTHLYCRWIWSGFISVLIPWCYLIAFIFIVVIVAVLEIVAVEIVVGHCWRLVSLWTSLWIPPALILWSWFNLGIG